MQNEPVQVFVGWDSRETIAYDVCKHSIERHASIPVQVVPLKQPDLRAEGLYWREADPLASTEFTYTRFLTPHLARKSGWAVFCDCDFLWLGDIAELIEIVRAQSGKAICCVQHDHRPTEITKMDNKTQTRYPRKNWSSLMAFHMEDPTIEKLTPDIVNTQSGAYLHRMQWVDDEKIGAIPETWNWLEGWCEKPRSGTPKVVHYTRGGPWFENWQDVEFGDLWLAEKARVEALGLVS